MHKPGTYGSGSNPSAQNANEEEYGLSSTDYDFSNTKSLYRPNKLTWILIIFIVILILVFIPFVIYAIISLRTPPVCTSKECLQTAASLKSSIDDSVDPCTNFYAHVCGKWDEYNIGHDGEELTNFVKISDKVDHMINKFIKQPTRKDDPLPVKMVRNFYEACSDTEKRDELGLDVMLKYLKQAGLPKVPAIFSLPPSKWKNYEFDWVKSSILLKKTFNLDLFLQFNVEENMFDQSKTVMYLLASLSPPSLPQILDEDKIEKHEDFTVLDELKREFKPVVKHIISEILINEPINPKVLSRASELIWNITFQIPAAAKIVGRGKQYDIRMHELKKMTFANLQNLTDTLVAQSGLRPLTKNETWKRYAELLLSEIGNTTLQYDEFYYFESELPYIVATPQYILKMSNVVIELFAWWKAVFLMVGSTTEEIANTISDAAGLTWDDSDCISLTVSNLNIALGFGIITEKFIMETKPEVTEFFESLREAFIERILELEWIDETTKNEALTKILNLGFVIGAPDWIINETAVMSYYKDITIRNDTHLDNILQMIQVTVKELFESRKDDLLDDQSDDNEISSVTDVNAYYQPLRNVMVIPWGILNPPIYHPGLSSINYGALGTIIGHELTHGFDGTGRRYDSLSNHRMWWTEKSLKEFNNRSTCFVKQYKQYTMNILNKKIPINATKTLNENIADNGGLKIAYRAFQKHLKKHVSNEVLPGFENYTSEQLFFLIHAHFWCNREGSLIDQVENHMDEHSPNDVRVMGMLHNMEEFADTFNCPVGSVMNPKRPRCNMW